MARSVSYICIAPLRSNTYTYLKYNQKINNYKNPCHNKFRTSQISSGSENLMIKCPPVCFRKRFLKLLRYSFIKFIILKMVAQLPKYVFICLIS